MPQTARLQKGAGRSQLGFDRLQGPILLKSQKQIGDEDS